jgi:tetratricopeptide (TPR) repeat protein
VTLFLLLLAASAAQAAPPPADEALRRCVAATLAEPSVNPDTARRVAGQSEDVLAGQCLGLAFVQKGQYAEGAAAFEEAARAAAAAADTRVADLWAQAGNGWLAAGEPLKARTALDAALATELLAPELRGEVHFDRARAAVALNDLVTARADLDLGLELVPADPFGWYLSSALALKEGRLARAQDDIAEALRLAPDDADLLVHAGNVAGISGEHEAARGLYARAIRAAPDSKAAAAARAALAANREQPSTPKPPAR